MARGFARLVVLAALLLASIGATAQSYPRKPVTVIIPGSAGGIMDMMARAVTQGMADSLGQPFVVDARPGAHGVIGADVVAKAPADGYVLLFSAETQIVDNPFLYAKLPYDGVKAFAPVGMCCVMAQAVVVNPSLPVASLRELVALAKSQPGKLAYASNGGGSGSHLNMEALRRLTGMDIVHVPYKGSAPAVTDLVAGRVSMMVVTLSVIQSQLRAGKLKALAVGSPKRSEAFPDVPTASEAGFAWDAEVWLGLFAPAGTPKEIVTRLNAEMNKTTRSQPFREQWLKRNGLDAASVGTADEFAAFVRAAMQKSERVIRESGVKLD